MLVAATTAAMRRRGRPVAGERRRLWEISGTAMLLGSGLTLAYVAYIVLGVRPWYEPRYLIPYRRTFFTAAAQLAVRCTV